MEATKAGIKGAYADAGGSRLVPNVQAIVAENKGMKEIPQRYIRHEIEEDDQAVILDGDDDGYGEIPVLDLRRLLHPVDSHDEMNKFQTACEDWGFFQLVNHGVAEEVIEKMKSDLGEFFNLPLEEKQKVAQLPNSIEGYGQIFVVSEDQKLDWADMFFLTTVPVSSRNMKLWPEQPPTFRKSLDEYSSELKKVSDRLFELMSKNLELEQQTLSTIFSECGRQAIRMNYYPPCPQANKVIGLSPHSDGGALLKISGSATEHEGRWKPVKPLPGALIVNIGDSLEILTNGRYKSIEHRAMVSKEKERLSIAAFHSPSIDVDIGPLEELVKRSKRCYKTVKGREFVKMFIARKLDGKSLLDQMKLEN